MEKGRRSKENINSNNNFNNKRHMTKEEQDKKKRTIKKVFIIIAIIILATIIVFIASNYIIFDKNKTTNLVINNNNVTSNLKNDIIIENDIIYISQKDIANFFDKYIYEEKENGNIITSYDKKIAEIGFKEDIININGSDKKIYAHAIKKDDNIYLPISEMKDVYGIEIENVVDTKVIVIDSINREQKKYTVKSNTAVKSTTGMISKTIDRVEKGNYVINISDSKNGYTKVRTEKGKIGYIKSDELTNEITVRDQLEEEVQIQGKVNMFWDYYSEYKTAPNRTGTKIEGINVVSPAFFHIDKSGKLQENVGKEGEEYINWAHSNGYKVWPMVANAGDGMLKVTSEIMNSYEKRNTLIESIVNVCVKYKLDGINIDFENMKQEDKDLYSRFIIELTPRIKEIGDVVSVDVTAPDGGETWSLCFDRHIIGNVANYIVFMAYDEYGVSSKKAGTTAGYNWVKLSLKKFLETEEIESNKIILAIPFYTRLWTQTQSGTTSKVITMKEIQGVIPSGVEKKWDEDLKQYYVEWSEGNSTKKMWIEDERSLKEKLSLIQEYNLAGVAEWQKGMETENIWNVIKEQISK